MEGSEEWFNEVIKLTEDEEMEYKTKVKKMSSNLAFHEINKILNRNCSKIMIPTHHDIPEDRSDFNTHLKKIKNRTVIESIELDKILNQTNTSKQQINERKLAKKQFAETKQKFIQNYRSGVTQHKE